VSLAGVAAQARRGLAVTASHDDFDHYNLVAFAAYPYRAVPSIVARGMAVKARRAGFTNVTEVEQWEQASVGALQITATRPGTGYPRSPMSSRARAPLCSSGPTRCASPNSIGSPSGSPEAFDLALPPVNGLRIRAAINRQVVMTAEQAAGLDMPLSIPYGLNHAICTVRFAVS
jgi:hypothetical protein